MFRAGALAKPGARPLYSLPAPLDGTPVHLGLGTAGSLDLRVKFPNGKVIEKKELKASPRMRLDDEGQIEALGR